MFPVSFLYFPAMQREHGSPNPGAYPGKHTQSDSAIFPDNVVANSGHEMHAPLPGAALYFPASHSTQVVVESATCLKVPGPQKLQLFAPSLLYSPFDASHSEQLSVLPVLYVPARHWATPVLKPSDVFVTMLPAGTVVQKPDFSLFEYVPSPQRVQAVPSPDFPAKQDRHSRLVVVVHADNVSSPAPHVWQVLQ